MNVDVHVIANVANQSSAADPHSMNGGKRARRQRKRRMQHLSRFKSILKTSVGMMSRVKCKDCDKLEDFIHEVYIDVMNCRWYEATKKLVEHIMEDNTIEVREKTEAQSESQQDINEALRECYDRRD